MAEAEVKLRRVSLKPVMRKVGIAAQGMIKAEMAEGTSMGVPLQGLADVTLEGGVKELVGGVDRPLTRGPGRGRRGGRSRVKRKDVGSTPLMATKTHIYNHIKNWLMTGHPASAFVGINSNAPERARKAAEAHLYGLGYVPKREWLALSNQNAAKLGVIAGDGVYDVISDALRRQMGITNIAGRVPRGAVPIG
jgi:hypothetical protein